MCSDSAWKECYDCTPYFNESANDPQVIYFCEKCAELTHTKGTQHDQHDVQDVTADVRGINELDLLSVICIETSHYVCFTRSEDRWVFVDSMANRISKSRTLLLYYPPHININIF